MSNLVIKLSGEIQNSNFDEWKNELIQQIRAVNNELKTDSEFALATKSVKQFKAAEKALKEAKQSALEQAADINQLFDAIDAVAEETRQVRLSLERQIKSRKQEIKEERRQHEISPELRQRIRSIQIAISRKRMLVDVPKADVVVTNPTHVAVALLYDAQTMNAPQVLAKGAELLSEKIKDIARQHNVPVVEKPQLARTLYDTVDVGQSVPETLFLAVAEVLAMIYRIRGRRRSQLGNNNVE